MPKLNDNKTVLSHFNANFTARLHETHIRIGDANVQVSQSARNVGVTGLIREGYSCLH